MSISGKVDPVVRPVAATDIAEANNIPKKFLDAILGDLRNAGVVRTKKGPGGGYMLARPPSEIKVGHVIRTLDGPLAPIACASRTAYQPCQDCDDVKTCTVRLTMAKVRDAMADILDRMTFADYHRVAALAEAGQGAHDLPGGVHARRVGRVLRLSS